MSADKRFPTRMHELLGVEPGEEFGLDGYLSRYYVDIDGYVRSYESKEIMWGEQVCDMINYPDRIIRNLDLTEKKVEILKAALLLGFNWLAKNEDGHVFLYEIKPRKEAESWIRDDKQCLRVYPAQIKGLVSWSDPEPLDIVQTLRENGVEVEK